MLASLPVWLEASTLGPVEARSVDLLRSRLSHAPFTFAG